MSVEHRRPLLAFFVITVVLGLFMGYSLKAQGVVDILGRNPVVSSAVAAGATLEVLRPTVGLGTAGGGGVSLVAEPGDSSPDQGPVIVPAPRAALVVVRAAHRGTRGTRAAAARDHDAAAGSRPRRVRSATGAVAARSSATAEGHRRGHLRGTYRGHGQHANAAHAKAAKTKSGKAKRHKHAHARKHHQGNSRARSARGRR